MSEPWTPGPWKILAGDDAGNPSEIIRADAEDPWSDAALVLHAGDGYFDFQNAADLRLMVLAPEMAELLEAWAIQESYPEQVALEERTRNLLARARGEEDKSSLGGNP